MEVRGFNEDMAKMFELTALRAEKASRSPEEINTADPIKDLVERLHPPGIEMVVTDIIEESANARTYRFKSGADAALPFFRAGQYLSIKASVGGVKVTRPYSISSAPSDSGSFYELTVSYKENGFLSRHIFDNWEKGTLVSATGPHGNFYHERLRDSDHVVALVGGDSITPIRSMARQIASGGACFKLSIIYGSCYSNEIIFKNELEELVGKNPGKISVCHVISEPDESWEGRRGFIDEALIKEVVGDPEGKSFFICGPPEMHTFCARQLEQMGIPRRMVRYEILGAPEDISAEPGYPGELEEKQFVIRVHRRGLSREIPANTGESVLVAFERAGLAPESQCRNGACGFCRSQLLKGRVYQRQGSDGRRAADKILGYFHPCSAYPLSDLELVIP